VKYEEMKSILKDMPEGAIHAKNFLRKLDKDKSGTKNRFKDKKEAIIFFTKYKEFYDCVHEYWIGKEKSFENIEKIVDCLNQYKDFVLENSKFSSQSKFESTILEEFIFWLFYDEIGNYNTDRLNGGSIKAYCNIYFSPKSMKDFINKPSLYQNTKDQDFAIYRVVKLKSDETVEEELKVPVVSIECKTYLDKTMLEGSIATAEKIKLGNPHARFYIVTERYEVKSDVDIAYTKIDQIFVLRKQFQCRNGELNPIYPDVVWKLYNEVVGYLGSSWADVKTKVEESGIVL